MSILVGAGKVTVFFAALYPNGRKLKKKFLETEFKYRPLT
jgi:hypothetical protein